MIEAILYNYGAQVVRSGSIRCPFHDDSHASGSVDLEKDLYYCFVCGVGGDAITLIRWRENLDFPDAVRLAEELTGESHESVRGGTAEQSGYGLPRRKGTRQRRKYIPPWVRG